MSNDLYDREAERRLILSVVAFPELLAAASAVKSADFQFVDYGLKWDRLTAAVRDNAPILPDEYLEPRDRLDDVIALPEYVSRDAETVRRLSLCRTALAHASAVAKAAYSGSESAVLEAARAFDDLRTSGPTETLRHISTYTDSVVDGVVNWEDAQADRYYTGFEKLDECLTIGRGTLTMIIARPAMGKTALMAQMADYASENGLVVALFSKEMTAGQIYTRMACRRARASVRAIDANTIPSDKRQEVAEEIFKLHSREGLYIDDSVPQDTEAVYSACAELKRRTGRLDLVLGDHLRLFADKADNETHRLGRISWGWKVLAKRLNTRAVLAAQLNRNIQTESDKRPDLHHMRDSGEPEENADNVIALYRDKYYDPKADNTAELIVRKARNGERNKAAKLVFLDYCMSFERLAPNGH